MAKKAVAALILMMCCTLGSFAQQKVSYLIESADSIVALKGTRHYVGCVPSGRIVTQDVIMDCLLRGHEKEYVVVTKVVDNKVIKRTWCKKDKISTADLVVKTVTTTEQDGQKVVVINFTNDRKWVTTDLRWGKALPGQKVKVTNYDGETYAFTSYISDGSVDQQVYHQLAMK